MIVLQLKNWLQDLTPTLQQTLNHLNLTHVIQNNQDELITLHHPTNPIHLIQDNCELYTDQPVPLQGNWTNHHVTEWITLQIMIQLYTTNGYALLYHDNPIKPTTTLQTWLQDFPTTLQTNIKQEITKNYPQLLK